VLGTPPAFVLSQDQTLKFLILAEISLFMLLLFLGPANLLSHYSVAKEPILKRAEVNNSRFVSCQALFKKTLKKELATRMVFLSGLCRIVKAFFHPAQKKMLASTSNERLSTCSFSSCQGIICII
jgi:hypothetical protein